MIPLRSVLPGFLVLTALLALLHPVSVRAQPSVLEVAPIHWSVDAWLGSDSERGGAALTTRRTVPLFFFLPNVSEDSRLDILGAAIGVRSSGDQPALAWAVRPLEAFISKAPWTGGIALLSYDRSGPLRVEADWLALTGGPALRLSDGRNSLEARLTATGSVSTVGLGGALFDGPRVNTTGFQGTLAVRLVGRVGSALVLSGRAFTTAMNAGPDPKRRGWQGMLTVTPARRIALGMHIGQLEVLSDLYPLRSAWLLGASIRLLPGQPGY